MLRTISLFSRWILISKEGATYRKCFSKIRRARSSDAGLLKVANFYKCYRAFVRGKVESIQANSAAAADGVEHTKRAARYFRLALRYATCGSEPVVFVIMGRVGTGKTTFAKQLGIELDWPVFRSDLIRKTLAGVPLTERTAPELRGKVYSEQMSSQTYAELVQGGLAALATNTGVILDATFSSRAQREYLRDECAKALRPSASDRTAKRSGRAVRVEAPGAG